MKSVPEPLEPENGSRDRRATVSSYDPVAIPNQLNLDSHRQPSSLSPGTAPRPFHPVHPPRAPVGPSDASESPLGPFLGLSLDHHSFFLPNPLLQGSNYYTIDHVQNPVKRGLTDIYELGGWDQTMGNIRPFRRKVAEYHVSRGRTVKLGGRVSGRTNIPDRNRRKGGGSRSRSREVVQRAQARRKGK